jgi:hypothetical protein
MAFTNALRRRIGASQFQLGEVRQGRDRTCVIAGCARIGSVEHNISSQIVADPIGLINQAGDISECPGINRPGRKGTISRSEGDKAESRPPASITTSSYLLACRCARARRTAPSWYCTQVNPGIRPNSARTATHIWAEPCRSPSTISTSGAPRERLELKLERQPVADEGGHD